MALTKRPQPRAVDESSIAKFISAAPDAPAEVAVASAPAAQPVAAVPPQPAVTSAPARPSAAPTSSRKQAISLTLSPNIIHGMDDAAGRLGLSRAAAIALACSRFIEAEQGRA